MLREYLYDRENLPGTAGSTWLAERERPPRLAFADEAACDVAVIGGGMTGVLTAVRLAERGAEVILLEGRRLCSDVSGHTSAKATAQHGAITNMPERARQTWLAENTRAIDRLERYASDLGDEAGFERAPSVLYATDAKSVESLRRDLELYASLELPSSLLESGLPDGVLAALRLDDQALIDPVGMCDGLLGKQPERLQVYEQTMVRAVDEEGDGVIVTTDRGHVRAGNVVVATHVPFFDTLMYSTRLFQERVYALEVMAASEVPAGMWYSDDEPHLSWRPYSLAQPRRLVISGLRHKAGHGGDERVHYRDLADACHARFGSVEVLRRWSTQDPMTPDGLPLIGKMIGRDRCFMASGYNGWGMTSSEVAAEVLSTLIGGGQHPLTDVVSPLRVGTSGLVTLAVENADFVAKAFTAEVLPEGAPADLAPGDGRPMRVHGRHVAVMRDADGALHASDAHCAHMRCGVEFNEAEGTWDCPCHGSRFYGDGSWLHGPARRGLERADVEDA